MPPVLAVQGVTKRFPGVVAVDRVSLEVYAGEVLALCGENGAGKSTLMKILSGVYAPDEGTICIDGRPVRIAGPLHAQQLGISIIHQELNLAPNLTVAQNILLGREPRRWCGLLLDHRAAREQAVRILAEFGIDLDPDAPVGSLSVGQRQAVEIARALSLRGRVLIMDEPTAALTLSETEALLRLIRDLKSQGVAIIFISHRLDEVFAIADRITVMRDGRTVGTLPRAAATRQQLVRLMVDREIGDLPSHTPRRPSGPPLLEVRDLVVPGRLAGASLTVHRGEIVGIAGLVGAGRTELALTLFGIYQPTQGEIRLNGQPVRISSPKVATALGIGLVPEDRKTQGLVLEMTVAENVSLAVLPSISPRYWLNRRQELTLAETQIQALGIRPPNPKQKVLHLSGGNQQKVVLAKWLARRPSLLIVDEPTRGVDVGAKAEVHALLRQMAGEGMGVLVISSDLPEVLALSDRIVVMRQGRTVAELSRDEATQERIMQHATGS